MARIRSVKPSLRTSRVVVQWRHEVRYFWVLLWGYLDDEGRGLDRPRAIAADCYPLEDNITAAKVEQWLKLIASTRRDPDRDPPLCRYQVNGERYLHTVYWDDNQRPARPTPSRIPPCPIHESPNGRLTESPLQPATESLTEPPMSRQVLEGEGGKEGRREGEDAPLERLTEPADPAGPPPGPPPPRTCPKHPDGTEQPCRACQRARQAAQAWETAQAQAKRSAKATTRAALADARNGPPCPHGQPGGTTPHPETGKPLCPLCRKAA